MRGWLVIVVCAGCASTTTVECPTGITCPADTRCTDHSGCQTDAQITACTGLADGMSCTFAGGVGACSEGGCFIATCGNALVEPGELCDDGNVRSGDGCSAKCDSNEICGNGIVELEEACDCGDADHAGPSRCNGTVNGGPQCTLACAFPRCGDDHVDQGEVCDDGNLISGDGCNATCTSDETCGNGTVDFARGEQCDAPDAASYDGCAPVLCQEEPRTWRENLAEVPPPRADASLAYDSARKRLVMFGGLDVAPLGDTWEFDGISWKRIVLATSPAPRALAMMTYDVKRGVIVLFGGTAGVDLSDTWEYDGIRWSPRTTMMTPPQRYAGSMAYDASRGCVVMYGGAYGSAVTYLDDTWELDASGWTPRASTMKPQGRRFSSMTYDPVGGRIVLFGGARATTFGDTWTLTAAGWKQLTTSGTPGPRYGASMTFDVAHGVIVLFGGYDTGELGDTWELNGSTWTLKSPSTPPSARHNAAMAYDLARQVVTLFGGTAGADETHAYDGTSWAPRLAPALPIEHSGAAMTYDQARGRLVMYGGATNAATVAETWELAGQTWIQRPDGPPARQQATLTYDSARKKAVLFGGWNGAADNAQTWEYNGTAWSQRTGLVPSPPARRLAAATYDTTNHRVVLFGGVVDVPAQPLAPLADTWTFDGTAWTSVIPAMAPSARFSAALAYDAKGKRVVLFGGTETGQLGGTVGDTWVFDGITWMQVTPATSPGARSGALMFYDPVRERIVLHGGRSDSSFYTDTWELDGAIWTEVPFFVAPPPRTGSAIAYDAVEHQAVLFGGTTGGTSRLDDTWAVAFTPLVATERCTAGRDVDGDGKAGCADVDCAATCALCGDGTCDAIEDCASCPADCTVGAACIAQCGNFVCDAGEMSGTCPGDCP